LFENFSVNSLTGDLSNNTIANPPLFSLVNTFNGVEYLGIQRLDGETGVRCEEGLNVVVVGGGAEHHHHLTVLLHYLHHLPSRA
jgi:hypothetical protein